MSSDTELIDTSPSIFLSYRRSATNNEARALADILKKEFGSDAVYFDQSDIKVGQLWTESISNAIDDCEIF